MAQLGLRSGEVVNDGSYLKFWAWIGIDGEGSDC